MEVLKLDNRNTTLVDSVEESLIRFFKEKGLRPGSSIPNEIELAASLGVGRPVLREALSPPSPLLRMVQLTDAQGRTPLHIAAARANPAALLLLHCMGARDTTPDREGRLALDIIQELGADEMAARLPFWENRGKQEGRMVVNLQQSKTVQIRGRKYRLEAKGFLSYASLATNEGELAYVAAVQGAAASLPEDERYNIQNNDTDLPYIPDHIGLSPLPGDSGRVSPWYWRNGGFRRDAGPRCSNACGRRLPRSC